VASDLRVVAITGASAGIGRATAIRLARNGVAEVLCARRAAALEAVAEEVRAAGAQALAIVADVTDAVAMEAFAAAAVSRFGRLDVMICNAGFGIAGAIDEISPAQMRQLVDVNYMGTFHAARAAMRIFRRQNTGHLIAISSIVGKRGVPSMGAYAATKFAQVGLIECLRAEIVGSGISATAVYPVSTETEFFEIMSRETGKPMMRALGPRQQPAQVADAIARAIERPVPEVYPHRSSRWLVWLNTFAPGLTDRIVSRLRRRPVRAKGAARS
jgi:NADP-dependent 3-hydroxy acid dehydrogenase YdfG